MDFDALRLEFSHKMDELVSKYKDSQRDVEKIFTKQIISENCVPKLNDFIQKRDYFEKITTTPQILKSSQFKRKDSKNPNFLRSVKNLEEFFGTNSSNSNINDIDVKKHIQNDNDNNNNDNNNNNRSNDHNCDDYQIEGKQIIKKLEFSEIKDESEKENFDSNLQSNSKCLKFEENFDKKDFNEDNKINNNNDYYDNDDDKSKDNNKINNKSNNINSNKVSALRKFFDGNKSLEAICEEKLQLSESLKNLPKKSENWNKSSGRSEKKEEESLKSSQDGDNSIEESQQQQNTIIGFYDAIEERISEKIKEKREMLQKSVNNSSNFQKNFDEENLKSFKSPAKSCNALFENDKNNQQQQQNYHSVLKEDMPKFFTNKFEEKFANIKALFEKRTANLSSQNDASSSKNTCENFKKPTVLKNIQKQLSPIKEENTEDLASKISRNSIDCIKEEEIEDLEEEYERNENIGEKSSYNGTSSTDTLNEEFKDESSSISNNSEATIRIDKSIGKSYNNNNDDDDDEIRINCDENSKSLNSLTFYSCDTQEMKSNYRKNNIDQDDDKAEDFEDHDEDAMKESTNNFTAFNLSQCSSDPSSSNKFCSTFTDELKKINTINGTTNPLDTHLEEEYIKYNNFIEAINEEANNLNSYINNFQITNSREIYMTNLKKRLEIQRNIYQQLTNFENAAMHSKKGVILEQSTMFSFLKFKTKTNIDAIERHFDYCKNEMNPIFSLIKGNGSLSICDVSVGCRRINLTQNSDKKLNKKSLSLTKNLHFPNNNKANNDKNEKSNNSFCNHQNHIMTAFFEYDGNVTFISPVLISKPQDICEFMQKFTFPDLPSDFKIKFAVAELILQCRSKASRSTAKNLLKKFKVIITRGKTKIMNKTKNVLKSSKKSLNIEIDPIKQIKKSNDLHHQINHNKHTYQLSHQNKFEIVGEIFLDKHSVSKSTFQSTIPSYKKLENDENKSNENYSLSTIFSGQIQMKLDIAYSVDLEYSGQMSMLCVDNVGDKYWVDNYVSLTNGKLFFWSMQQNNVAAASADIISSLSSNYNNNNQNQIGSSSQSQSNAIVEAISNDNQNKEMKLNEVVLLSNLTRFIADASQFTQKPHSIVLQITRNWTASDRTNILQQMIGNMLVRQIYLSLPNARKHTEWVRNLRIVIQSHKEWND